MASAAALSSSSSSSANAAAVNGTASSHSHSSNVGGVSSTSTHPSIYFTQPAAFKRIDNYINGVSVPPSTNSYQPLFNPATGKQQGEVALSSSADVEIAVQAARTAFASWSKLTIKARALILFRYHQLIEEHYEELSELITREHGKNKSEALGDLQKGNETVEYACSLPQIAQGKILEVSGGVTCQDTRVPLGVVASIVPFNFPFMVPHWTLPLIVGMGNTLVLKPSEKVPITMNRVMELVKKAGIPDGVINIVNGTAAVVNALCDHPEIDCVTFVGSTGVAEHVYNRAKSKGKRALCLGGAKNHLVALNDCNVDMASTDIVNSYTGCSGQRCMAASALLMVGEQQDLLNELIRKSSALLPGQAAGQVGPVIDGVALARITKYIDEAESKYGAKVLVDGRPWSKKYGADGGNWIGPTILLHKKESGAKDPAFTEEIFGPVLSILVVDSHQQAIDIENGNPYGNAAAIYTTVGAHAEWFSARFQAGMIGVNIGVPVPREPFSFAGWNRSKFGDVNDLTGDSAIELYSKRKKITTKWNAPLKRTNADWMH